MHFNLYVRKMHENLIINLGLKVFVRKKKNKKKGYQFNYYPSGYAYLYTAKSFFIGKSAFDSNPQASSC